MSETNGKQRDELDKDGRDALFRLLTEEIKDLTEADKLQGWTPWVVSATLISMAWLIVQDIWKASPLIAPIHAVFLIVSLVLALIITTRGFFNLITYDFFGRAPFTLLHINTTILDALVTMLWIGTIAVTCLTLSVTEGRYLLFIAGSFFGLQTIAGLGIIFVIAFRLPIPMGMRFKTIPIILYCVESALCIAVITTIARSDAVALAQVSDIRIGGLLALGSYALMLLCRGGTGRSTTKKTLAELRRDIMLGSLSLEEARHRTHSILEGLWLSDVVREDIRILLKHISDVAGIYTDAFRSIEALMVSVSISTPHTTHPSEIEKIALSNTLDVLEMYEKRVQDVSKQYFERLRGVQIRLKLASRLIKLASSDEVKLMAEIKRAQEPVDEAMERFVQGFHEAQNAWNLWFPTEARQYNPFGISAKDISKKQLIG